MCIKPVIPNGSVSPSNASVPFMATYEVTCDDGCRMIGGQTMTCGTGGVFDQTPICGNIIKY